MRFLRSLWRRVGESGARPAARRRLRVELLEDRLVPVVGAFSVPPPVAPGTGFDGVIQILTPNAWCSGSLLYTGRDVLTAAHCVDDNKDGVVDAGAVSVQFDLPGGPITIRDIPATNITLHPAWDGDEPDMAVIHLPVVAPAGAERYDIYRGHDEGGKVMTVAGYGATGTGTTGEDGTFGKKRCGLNRYDLVYDDKL